MTDDFPAIITLHDAANLLLTTPNVLEAELEKGRLRGFRVGNEWRVTRQALLEFIGEHPAPEHAETTTKPRTDALGGIDMSHLAWTPIDPFTYNWPKKAGAPPNTEDFYRGSRAEIKVSNQSFLVDVAFTNRKVAGKNRRRAVVFIKGIPAVEFVGADNFDESHLLASVVKGKDGKHIRHPEELPIEYATIPIDIYTNLITGPYAARSVAVVADENDFTLMARHAIIRALWKGWLA